MFTIDDTISRFAAGLLLIAAGAWICLASGRQRRALAWAATLLVAQGVAEWLVSPAARPAFRWTMLVLPWQALSLGLLAELGLRHLAGRYAAWVRPVYACVGVAALSMTFVVTATTAHFAGDLLLLVQVVAVVGLCLHALNDRPASIKFAAPAALFALLYLASVLVDVAELRALVAVAIFAAAGTAITFCVPPSKKLVRWIVPAVACLLLAAGWYALTFESQASPKTELQAEIEALNEIDLFVPGARSQPTGEAWVLLRRLALAVSPLAIIVALACLCSRRPATVRTSGSRLKNAL